MEHPVTPSAAGKAAIEPTNNITYPNIRELRQNLPPHCFKPSLLRSLSYVLRSALFVAGLFFCALKLLPLLPSPLIPFAWCAYWFLQGTVFWGMFTLAHDCGHGSFSRHRELNYWMGIFLNSFILVPYESWRLTHRHHHQFNANIDRDEVFYPVREKDSDTFARIIPCFLGFAWFIYLVVGFFPRKVQHFNPWDKFFANHKSRVIISLLGWGTAVAIVSYCVYLFGLAAVVKYYGIPIVIFSSWLVVVTFLHHNDPATPWYSDNNWSFVKGALSSVDRSYGSFINMLTHNIGTHQVHHLFPGIPHYHLKDAAAALQTHYPHLVKKSSASIIPAYILNLANFIKYGGSVSENADTFIYQEEVDSDVSAQEEMSN